jgi:hypothetical protein
MRISVVWVGPRPFSAGTAELDLVAYLLSASGGDQLGERLREYSSTSAR